jgi:cobalt-zinc-cadmium efflux system outer membrane protein
MAIFKWLRIAITFFGLVSCARADTNTAMATTRISLQDAKNLAFLHNWDLLAACSGVAMADAQRIVTEEFPNPTFGFSTAKINTANRGNGTPSGNDVWDRSYDNIFAVNQLLEIGKRGPRQDAAKAGLTAARASFADARRTLDAGMTKAYVAAVLAEANAKVLDESSGYLRKEAEIAQIQFNAGDKSQSDLDRIELAAQQDELNALSAKAAAIQQRIAVQMLLGERHPTGEWIANDTVEDLANLLPEPKAKENAKRPDLIAAEATLSQSDANLRLQKAMRIPDPTLSLQYEHNPPDMPNTVGIGITIPLPFWNQNGGAIQAAKEARDQAERSVEQTKAQIDFDIATARAAYDEALTRWRYYRDKLRPKSATVRQTVFLAYEKGGASLVDLLEAQRDDNTIRLAAAQAAADTATASAALYSALNKISCEMEDL